MTTQQEIDNERELGRLVSIEDEVMRGRGHVPTWTYGQDGNDLTAAVACARCEQRAAVRIFADGRAWSAGRLRVVECVTAPE